MLFIVVDVGVRDQYDSAVLQVHLKSQFILNGVCVTWRGWLDLRRLDGVGRFEFDEERAQVRHRHKGAVWWAGGLGPPNILVGWTTVRLAQPIIIFKNSSL